MQGANHDISQLKNNGEEKKNKKGEKEPLLSKSSNSNQFSKLFQAVSDVSKSIVDGCKQGWDHAVNFVKDAGDATKQEIIRHKPTKKGTILALSSLPPLIDATAYASLVLSQELTCIFSAGIIPMEEGSKISKILLKPEYLGPLLVLPAFAAMGVLGLGVYENRELVGEKFEKIKKDKSTTKEYVVNKIKAFKNVVVKHPVEVTCVLVASIAEGVIIYSNLGYLSNEFFPTKFANTKVFYTGLGIAFTVGFEFVILHGRHLIRLTRQGLVVPEYRNPESNKIVQVLAVTLVEGLPVLSSILFGTLAAAEAYELAQYLICSGNVKRDIANHMAWLPSFIIGTLYFTCHLALYGKEFKTALANWVRQRFYSDEYQQFKIKEDRYNKLGWKLFLYPSTALILAAAYIISLGAVDELTYMLYYSEPTPTPVPPTNVHPPIMRLWLRIIAFGIPVFAVAIETFAVEVLKLFRVAGLSTPKDDEDNKNFTDLVVQKWKKKAPLSKPFNYNLQRFISDIFSVVVICSVKIGIDFIYMPNSVRPEQSKLSQNLLIASVLGLIASGRYATIQLFHFFDRMEAEQVASQQQENTGLVVQVTENSREQKEEEKSEAEQGASEKVEIQVVPEDRSLKNQPSLTDSLRSDSSSVFEDLNVADTSNSKPAFTSKRQAIIHLACLGLVVTGVTAASQWIIRYVMLDEVKEQDEAMDRLNSAQQGAAIIGSVTAVFATPIYRTAKNAFISTGKSCMNFFKAESTPSSINSQPSQKPSKRSELVP